MTNDHYENQLAQHINFACVQCQSKLHLTNFPRQTEFVLTCPCCKRKGRYNLHQLLDDALEHATRTGSLTELSAALQLGADVEVRVNWRGYEMPPAAVTVASRKPQRYAIMRRLIDEKADLDVHDHHARTLLVNAIMHNDYKLYQLLVMAGANPHLPSECAGHIFPIHAVFVTKNHHPNLDILLDLLDRGCSPQTIDGHGNPVLKYAALCGDHISMAVVMRALNWHLHAPESLRARKLSELLNSPPPADIRPTLVAQDMSVLLPQENMILTPPPPDGECGAGVDVPAALQAVLLGTPPSNRQTGLPPESELQAPTPPDYLRSVWNSKFDPSEPSDDSNPSVTDGSSLPSVPSPSTMDRDTEFDGPQPQRFATLEQMGSGVQQACGDADTFDHKAVSHGRVEEACLGGRMGPMAHHPPAAGGAGAASADAPPKTPPQTPPRKRNKPGCGSGGMGSGEPSTGAGSGVGIDAFSGGSGGRGSSGGDGGGSGGGGPH